MALADTIIFAPAEIAFGIVSLFIPPSTSIIHDGQNFLTSLILSKVFSSIFARAVPASTQNLEKITLAHVPWIVRHGAAAYRAIGTRVAEHDARHAARRVRRPGVVEIPFGTSWRTLIEHHGGGVSATAVTSVRSTTVVRFPRNRSTSTSASRTRPCVRSAQLRLRRPASLVLDVTTMLARLLEIARFFMKEQCG